MTEVGTGEALNLDELKALADEARCGEPRSSWRIDDYGNCDGCAAYGHLVLAQDVDDHNEPWLCEGCAQDGTFLGRVAVALGALVAEVERLRAQRDEALRELDGAPAPLNVQSVLLAAVLRAKRILSRTEDGTQPRSYYDTVRSMTADPDVVAAVDKAEAEDGTDGN